MAWDLLTTMGALAFGADDGLASLSGDPQQDSLALQSDLNARTFPQIAANGGGNWTLVWGPYALSENGLTGFHIINAMYVAQQEGTRNFVIGIAGTDFRSFYDWLVEDFDITPAPWPYADAGTYETGAQIGLQHLQGMTPYSGTSQPGVTLIDYLPTLSSSPLTIYVAGHSLGGALTEVVALWLADTRRSGSAWDPNGNATIVPFSFAGPTPGDPTWVAHFNDTFQSGAGQRFWNTNDVVPHAWNAAQVGQIKTLYGTVAPPNALERIAIDLLIAKASLHDYEQVLGNGTPATEAVQVQLTSFAHQAIYQHITAYYSLLGLPQVPLAG